LTLANLRDNIILMPGNKSPNSKLKTQKFWSLVFGHWSLKKGFTLIEILIVISIIGVLTGISTVSYTKSQGKTRDTQRKNDLESIKSALNLYYQQNSKYPPACTSHAPDQGCYSTDSQPWIPDTTSVINTLPKDPTQLSQNIFGAKLASTLKFNLVTPVHAEGGGGGGCSPTQAAAFASYNTATHIIEGVSVLCNGSGYFAQPYVIFSGCADASTVQATATAHLVSQTVDNITVDTPGANYTCTPNVIIEAPPGGGPTPTPAPTPGPTPFPTPPPTSGCTTAVSVDYYYCYSVNAPRNRYKIWARLDNDNDSEVSTNTNATCFDASPPGNLNYCVESE